MANSIDLAKKRLKNSFSLKEFYDPFFIAEIGINHNGSLDIAKQLIEMAVLAGCDAVKFQKRTIEIVYNEETLNTPRESPWGKTTKEQKEGLEFNQSEYLEIDEFCRSKNILWSASAWDKKSQEFLRKFNLPFNKVASAMATNLDFLKFVAQERRPTYVSTGMMDLNDVENIIKIFSEHKTELCLFHTVSVYPSPEDSLNLSMIKVYKEKYNIPIGYSGHEVSVSPSIIATALGASAIERHITIDRSMYGSDQSASLEASGLHQLLNIIRKYKNFLGNGNKTISKEEAKISSKLRYWN